MDPPEGGSTVSVAIDAIDTFLIVYLPYLRLDIDDLRARALTLQGSRISTHGYPRLFVDRPCMP